MAWEVFFRFGWLGRYFHQPTDGWSFLSFDFCPTVVRLAKRTNATTFNLQRLVSFRLKFNSKSLSLCFWWKGTSVLAEGNINYLEGGWW